MKLRLVVFDGIVMVGGTVTEELLLDSLTVVPPLGAGAVSVIVQASVPDPVTVTLLHESAPSAAGTAVPVPLSGITVVGLVEELLVIVSCPVAAPAVGGSNTTLKVAVWSGFNVIGNALPDIEKPAPVTAAPFMVTGAVPVEVRVTACGAAAVFTTTLPNDKLAALILSAGARAFSCRVKFFATLPAEAVTVAICPLVTAATLAVKPALVACAGTVTLPGTVTAELLLDKFTVSPPSAAGAVNATVHAVTPAPVMAPLLHVRPLNATGLALAIPVPLRSIRWVPVVELLAKVSWPVTVPAAAGLNWTFRLNVPPAAIVTGRLLGPTTENGCPLEFSWAIWTGALPSFIRETAAVAVLPTGTDPKVTVVGDALSVPLLAPTAAKLPTQLEST